MKPYNKSNIPLARKLRKEMTPWERKLWHEFLRDYPIRFQRQKAIGNYIADFYCAKARLVVELDGSGHYETEKMQADESRTEALERMNLRVVRFCNLDINGNFRGVCEKIDMIVQESLPQSPSATSPSSEGAIYALGFFDGVHLGHQALLSACRDLARKAGCVPGAVTFGIHPEALVAGQAPKLLGTPQQRKALLSCYGMEEVLVLPFDEALRNKPWCTFLEELEEKGAAGFVCGDDFRFGFRGEGNASLLETYCREKGLFCAVVPGQSLEGQRISSTHIRKCIEEGKMEEAVRFLGHPHMLSGQVVPGRGLGHTLGIPTANLPLPEGVVCPRYGVYACKALAEGKEYLAVTNVGMRPTVGGSHVTVEPWLLDFEGDLYGKELTLQFYSFLRPEEKFSSLEALKQQIIRDADRVKAIFQK